MAFLSLGGGLGKWGMPSPLYNHKTGKYESDGLIWMGKNPPLPADYTLLDKKFGPGSYAVDKRSIVGKKDPAWSNFRDENKKKAPYHRKVILGWWW